jgi:hypothetical protein
LFLFCEVGFAGSQSFFKLTAHFINNLSHSRPFFGTKAAHAPQNQRHTALLAENSYPCLVQSS